MGWDVLILKLKRPDASARTLTADDVLPLGSQAELRAAIDSVIPDVDWSDPEWGATRINGCWMEFNIKSSDGLDIGVHVHGAGDAVPPILALCQAHGWVAFDTCTAEFLDPAGPSTEGWERFQAFRKKIAERFLNLPKVSEEPGQEGPRKAPENNAMNLTNREVPGLKERRPSGEPEHG
jgi:hypothetical protein